MRRGGIPGTLRRRSTKVWHFGQVPEYELERLNLGENTHVPYQIEMFWHLATMAPSVSWHLSSFGTGTCLGTSSEPTVWHRAFALVFGLHISTVMSLITTSGGSYLNSDLSLLNLELGDSIRATPFNSCNWFMVDI
jgi:hypothetical protein